MTLLEVPERSPREASIPVLETERLVLRAPRLEDAERIAMLANERRIAENTARIPHPYRQSDAETWISGTNLEPGEETYLITHNGAVIQPASLLGFVWEDFNDDGQIGWCLTAIARPRRLV